MFPLESVVLPGAVVPLHIFEPRYRRLARDLDSSAITEFAMVPITRGREVGGGDQRSDIAVVARVLQAEELPDGRWALAAVATRRVTVVEWLTEDPYPLASVLDRPDQPDGDPSEALTGLVAAFGRLADTVHRIDPRHPLPTPRLDDDDPSRTIWQLIGSAGLATLDELALLGCSGARQRAVRATELIEERRGLLDALEERDR